MNLFVYRPGAIGDTILTLPALAALRHRFPGCHISYAGNTACLPILPVELAISADDTRLLSLFAEPPRLWRDFDMHILFSRQPFALDRSIQLDPLQAISNGRHMADWLVDAIDSGFDQRDPTLHLQSARGPDRVEPKVVIHPGAGSESKRWAPSNFAAVANALDLQPVVVTGPADDGLQESVSAELTRPPLLWPNHPLRQLAEELQQASLFIGNDSGITHLAAALGVPTVAIYVATDPRIWGIRGRHTRQLTGRDLSVDRLIADCQALMAPDLL